MWKITLLFSIFLMMVACTKQDITINQTHTNETIEDNTPPPFNGVSTLQIQNFINRAFIDLRGREPIQEEIDQAILLLEGNDLSDDSKDALLNFLIAHEDYFFRFFEGYSSTMLAGTTFQEIYAQIFQYQTALVQAQQSGDEIAASFIQIELESVCTCCITVANLVKSLQTLYNPHRSL